MIGPDRSRRRDRQIGWIVVDEQAQVTNESAHFSIAADFE